MFTNTTYSEPLHKAEAGMEFQIKTTFHETINEVQSTRQQKGDER